MFSKSTAAKTGFVNTRVHNDYLPPLCHFILHKTNVYHELLKIRILDNYHLQSKLKHGMSFSNQGLVVV